MDDGNGSHHDGGRGGQTSHDKSPGQESVFGLLGRLPQGGQGAGDGFRRGAVGDWGGAQFGGDGYWNESNATLQPRSFFYAQLTDRLGPDAAKRGNILPVENEASSCPTVAQAKTRRAMSIMIIEGLSQAPSRSGASLFAGSCSCQECDPLDLLGHKGSLEELWGAVFRELARCGRSLTCARTHCKR